MNGTDPDPGVMIDRNDIQGRVIIGRVEYASHEARWHEVRP